MNEKERLLHEYSHTAFAAEDIKLFLDTHPFHTEALSAYRHYCRTAAVLKKEYEKKYGALVACDAADENSWQWIEGPWPWEYKGGK